VPARLRSGPTRIRLDGARKNLDAVRAIVMRRRIKIVLSSIEAMSKTVNGNARKNDLPEFQAKIALLVYREKR
jgi:hypothetical protein